MTYVWENLFKVVTHLLSVIRRGSWSLSEITSKHSTSEAMAV